MPTRPIRPYNQKTIELQPFCVIVSVTNNQLSDLPLFSPLNDDDLQLSQVTFGLCIDFVGVPWIF